MQTRAQAANNKPAQDMATALSVALVEMVGADKASIILKDAARLVPYSEED